MRDELKKRQHEQKLQVHVARHNYNELLEFIHTRYDPDRLDNPSRSVQAKTNKAKVAPENASLRLPVELERRFLEILLVIIDDSWELPHGCQWIELLAHLKAFEWSSQMMTQDNEFSDCFRFFHKASQLYGFEREFMRTYTEQYQVMSNRLQPDFSLKINSEPHDLVSI